MFGLKKKKEDKECDDKRKELVEDFQRLIDGNIIRSSSLDKNYDDLIKRVANNSKSLYNGNNYPSIQTVPRQKTSNLKNDLTTLPQPASEDYSSKGNAPVIHIYIERNDGSVTGLVHGELNYLGNSREMRRKKG